MCTATVAIILDCGASHTVFNYFYRRLVGTTYYAITLIKITGIGGATRLTIESEGKVIFVGQVAESFYSPGSTESVVSGGMLCRLHDISVLR